jgi:hypothetical protein
VPSIKELKSAWRSTQQPIDQFDIRLLAVFHGGRRLREHFQFRA